LRDLNNTSTLKVKRIKKGKKRQYKRSFRNPNLIQKIKQKISQTKPTRPKHFLKKTKFNFQKGTKSRCNS